MALFINTTAISAQPNIAIQTYTAGGMEFIKAFEKARWAICLISAPRALGKNLGRVRPASWLGQS